MAEEKEQSTLGKVAGVAGNLLDTYSQAMAGDTVTTPGRSGFNALPGQVQDLLLKEMFPDIVAQYNMPRPKPIMREYTEAEALEPIFGSQARLGMQRAMTPPFTPEMQRKDVVIDNYGNDVTSSLPGYNAETDSYMTPFGQVIQGEAGKRAAEAAGIGADIKDMFSRAGRRMQGSEWLTPAMMTESGRVNPYTGRKFDRQAALDAISTGDFSSLYQQGGNAIYDPTRSLMQKLIPMAALAAIGAPIAGAVAPAVSGLTGSTLAGNIAGKAASSLIGRAGQ